MEGYYRYIELDKWGGKFQIKERSLKNIQRHELLIRVHYASIHPHDLEFIKGNYGEDKPDIFPITPGFEGCGEIIKVGDKINRKYVGKRCTVFAEVNPKGSFEGLWAEYHYTTLTNLLIYDTDIPYEKICSFINPLTTYGIIDTIKKKNFKTLIQTNASSLMLLI